MDFSEEMADEILKIFQVESEEIISKLNNSLLDLEKNPKDKDAILVLFRDAHSLKGASRMVGFNNVQSVAHKMEDILGLAKDNEIVLNSKVVDILYKTVDFLSELIQKSISKGHEVYTDDIAKHIAQLENVNDLVEEAKPQDEQSELDSELLGQNIDKINDLLAQSLFLLMKIEIQKEEGLIKEFLAVTKTLYEMFQKIGPYEIKKWLEDIKFKLEFTTRASNSFTNSEIEELHQTLDNIINKLISLCELYNFSVIDYYSAVFTKMAENPEIKIESKTELAEIPESIERVENIEKAEDLGDFEPEQVIVCEKELVCNLGDLRCITEKISALAQNMSSIDEITIFLENFLKDCSDIDVKKIIEKVIKILEFVKTNELQLDAETAMILSNCIENCDTSLKNESEMADKGLIFQQLEIVQQLLEINNIKSEDQVSVSAEGHRVGNRKITDFSKVFDTGSIKTLRVDSSKLDSLVNQVSELTITKIKINKHLQELDSINKELEDWQKDSIKTLSFLKYYDKKYFQSSNSDNPISFFMKQLLTLFTDNSKKVQEAVSSISNLHRTIQDDDTKMSVIVDNLEHMVKNIRVLPLATVFHLFGRMVRDIAQEKGKDIELEIIGSETSTDKKIIEEIKTPLIHIIRNAIDHGIETPADRIAQGKNPTGKIVLSAKQVGNKVVIQIQDDGRGINVAKIKEKAIAKGYLTQEEINSMSDEQIMNIIFSPGFSTGDEITSISGRGIGLDVVQSKISQLNGKVKIISEFSKGCCVQIELPTAMSTLKVFLVKSSGQTFAIPMEFINTVLRKNTDEIVIDKGRKSIIFNEKTISLYNLADILNLPKVETSKTKETILIIESDEKIFALCVDNLIGDQEILHKKLSAPLYKLKNISGVTTLASGEICLILNIPDVLNYTATKSHISLAQMPANQENGVFKILLVDDSITTRTMEKNILTKAGYKIETATNPIEAFEILKNNRFELIISDIEMPEMNGLEFLEKLKTDEMYFEIPVIMLSSLRTQENKRRAYELGASDFIVKGEFEQEEFLQAIEKVLQNYNLK